MTNKNNESMALGEIRPNLQPSQIGTQPSLTLPKLPDGFTGGVLRGEGRVPSEGRSPLIDFESVEERVQEAFETLRALPDPAPGPRVKIMALWREVLPERVDIDGEGSDARPGVSRGGYARMEEAFRWCECLSGPERRLLGRVMMMRIAERGHVEWPVIRRQLGETCTTDALRKRYSRALSRICGKLNAGAGVTFAMSRPEKWR
jgi:hypothetical protein